MRRQAEQKRRRRDLAWCLVGFLAVQLAVAVLVDQFWLKVRDPEYTDVERIIRARQAEAPGRPLVVALGSSRTLMALDAGSLNQSAKSDDPLVVNGAVFGGGPMMNQVILRRLLKAGIRPDLVLFEIMPMGVSAQDWFPVEERNFFQGRYAAGEAVRVSKSCDAPYLLAYHWGRARVFPCGRHQVELRDALGIDQRDGAKPTGSGRDAHGWLNWYPRGAGINPGATRGSLDMYRNALTQPALSKGALRACREALAFCKEAKIPVVIVVSPENSGFRNGYPHAAECHLQAIRGLALESGVALLEAQTWVDDSGFWDGHHVNPEGAEQFTKRLGGQISVHLRGQKNVQAASRR